MTLLPSVSAVVAAGNGRTLEGSLERVIVALDPHFAEIEIVVVANGVSSEMALSLKRDVLATPDTTGYFIVDEVDEEVACLIGLEHAIGDYVLLTDATEPELARIPSMVAAIREGFDLVTVSGEISPQPRPLPYRGMRAIYYAIINALSTVEILRNPPTLRLMTRAASVYLLSQLNAELLLRAASLSSSFPAKMLMPAYTRSAHPANRSLSLVGRGFRSLVLTSSRPLRAAIFIGCAGAASSIVYSIYAIAVYFLKAEVQPGWTTLSLAISGMMFFLFVILALIAEYVLQIHSRMPSQRRYHVARELRSPLTRNERRRNVIVETNDQVEIGMPSDLMRRSS